MKYIYIDSKELKGKLDYADMLLFFGIALLIFLIIKYFDVSGIIKWVLYLISAFFIMLLIDCLTTHQISYCRSCDEAFDFDATECPLCGKKLEHIGKNYLKDIREEASQETKEMVDSTVSTKSSSAPPKTSVHKIKRKKGIDGLIHALKDDDWNTRRNAVYALGNLRDKRAVEVLIHSLNDNHRYIRRSAALTLGKLNDARAVEPLIQLINDDDTKTRENAVIALGKLGNKKAIPALEKAFYDKAQSVRAEVENSLFLLGWNGNKEERQADISMDKIPPEERPRVEESEEIIAMDIKSVLSTTDLEGSVRRHIDRIKRVHSSHRGFSTMGPHWDKLLRYDIRSFTLETIYQEFEKSITENKHHYQGRQFDDIYVAVSTIPALDYSRARTYFSRGYFGFMDTLLNMSNYKHGDIDFAHWIFCYDGKDQYVVNLTFMPARELVGPDSISILPDELLTEEEKEIVGLPNK